MKHISIWSAVLLVVCAVACTFGIQKAVTAHSAQNNSAPQSSAVAPPKDDVSGEERANECIHPYGSEENTADYSSFADIPLTLIDQKSVPSSIFQTQSDAAITLYADSLCWQQGKLRPADDAALYKLEVQLDDRQYVLLWGYLQFGIVDYKLFDTPNGPVITIISDMKSNRYVSSYLYKNGLFCEESENQIYEGKILDGGVNSVIPPVPSNEPDSDFIETASGYNHMLEAQRNYYIDNKTFEKDFTINRFTIDGIEGDIAVSMNAGGLYNANGKYRPMEDTAFFEVIVSVEEQTHIIYQENLPMGIVDYRIFKTTASGEFGGTAAEPVSINSFMVAVLVDCDTGYYINNYLYDPQTKKFAFIAQLDSNTLLELVDRGGVTARTLTTP